MDYRLTLKNKTDDLQNFEIYQVEADLALATSDIILMEESFPDIKAKEPLLRYGLKQFVPVYDSVGAISFDT